MKCTFSMHRALVLLAGAAVLSWGFQASAQEIRVGTWKTAQTIQPFLYPQYFPASQPVRVFSFTNPADQKTALLAGDLEMCGTTLVHAIQSAVQGQPVVVVASLCNKASALVVRSDGSVGTISDLRGKRIGTVPGTMHEILLRDVLFRAGLSPERDVKLMRVDFFDMGTALAAGNIDAFLSGEPFPSLAEAKGYGRILTHPYFDDSIGTINAGMLVRKATVEKNPQLVQQLVLAQAQATQHLVAHPEDWLRKASEFGTEISVLEKARLNIELSWDMDEAYVERARRLGEKMQALNMIDRLPDFSALFDLSFVGRVREELRQTAEGAPR